MVEMGPNPDVDYLMKVDIFQGCIKLHIPPAPTGENNPRKNGVGKKIKGKREGKKGKEGKQVKKYLKNS